MATGSEWQPKLDSEKEKKEEYRIYGAPFHKRMLACPRKPSNYCTASLGEEYLSRI
jgi:hypothetical protein